MKNLVIAAAIAIASQGAAGGLFATQAQSKPSFFDETVKFVDLKTVDCGQLKQDLKTNFYLRPKPGNAIILAGETYNCRILNSNIYDFFEATGTRVQTRNGGCNVWSCKGVIDVEFYNS